MNLHEPPNPSDYTNGSRRTRVLRGLFFVTNFSCGTLVFFVAMICIAEPSSGGGTLGSLLGALVGVVPTLIYMIAEWLAYCRNERHVERALGYVMLGFAAFTLFGIVTNVGEALLSEEDAPEGFWFIFALFISIGLVICGYLVICGSFRLRTTRRTLPSGHSA